MANISTTNKNDIYKYTATITTLFENDDDPLIITPLRIKSIIADYNYDSHNLPLIYVTVALTFEQLNKMKDNMANGTVLFNLQKYIENSDMPGLKVDYVNAECVYLLTSDTGKNKEQAMNEDKTEDYGYLITMGLIALDHINKNKTSINGIITKGSMSATLYYVLTGHTILFEPLDNNVQLKQVFIPPMKSVSRTISYLNNLAAFYDTPYRFFMDFDVTYLMSSSGRALKKKGESITTVKVKIVKDYDEANMEGMKEDKENNLYLLNVSASYSNLMNSEVTERTYTAIKGVNTSGATTEVPLTDELSSIIYKSNSSNVRLTNENTKLLDNVKIATINNSVVIGCVKNKVDGSIFTINKYYYIDADEAYGPEISGVYILSSKREVYSQEGQGLAMAILLTFKRLSDDQVEQTIAKGRK